MRKHGFTQRVVAFLEGKGFYIVLLICVVAIGLSGYYLFRSMRFTFDQPTEDLTAAVDGSATVVVTPSPELEAVKPTVDPTPTPDPVETASPESSEVTETPTPEVSETPKSAPTLFVWPLNGATVTAFSPDTLIRDETMGDWRTHDGVDLSCDLGLEVMATAEGTVESVQYDDRLGTVVTIQHGGDITSVYANLAEEVLVAAGDTVKAGTVIGTVGATASAESGLAPHLHFAMYENGEPTDPAERMAQRFG
jgi:murein DD-endopeptidase MepM/ murein hydrolase activator NlpD